MGALIRRALLACGLLFLGLAVAGTPAYAQTGQVKGKIVDAKNSRSKGPRSSSKRPTAWAGSSS